jgi:hypothetical protein
LILLTSVESAAGSGETPAPAVIVSGHYLVGTLWWEIRRPIWCAAYPL